MKQLTVAEFRRNTSRVLGYVQKGESIRLLCRGKEVAKIVPANGYEAVWKRPVTHLIMPGASLSQAVLEERL